MMKKTLLSLSILALAASAQPAFAETRIETVLGTITSVTPLTTNIVRKPPRQNVSAKTKKYPSTRKAVMMESSVA